MSFRSPAHLGGVTYRATTEAPFEISATIDIPAGVGLTTADRLRFFEIGANHRILELTVDTDDLDSNASPTITLNAGFESHNTGVTATNLTAYASASTIGQAGGTARFEPVLAAPGATYTVTLSPQAGAATAPVGATRVTVTAVVVPVRANTAPLLGSGLGNAYDHGRPNPAV
jgi:hypothetical protein